MLERDSVNTELQTISRFATFDVFGTRFTAILNWAECCEQFCSNGLKEAEVAWVSCISESSSFYSS